MAKYRDDDPRNKRNHIADLPAIEGEFPEGIISSMDLVDLTGATYRQIDYWCREGIIKPAKAAKGQGSRRYFSKDIVDRVKLIVKISHAFSRENSPMRMIFDNYEDGFIDLGGGIQLTWDTVEIEREV